MGWVSGVVVFFITWWTVLFAVLPWGNKPPEEPEPGHAPSAPAKPRLLLKFGITTVITAVIWLIIFALIESDLISFRDMARGM
jgi:predicted secreted protein